MSPVSQGIRRLAGAMLVTAIITAPIIANAAAEPALGATRTLHSLSTAQLT